MTTAPLPALAAIWRPSARFAATLARDAGARGRVAVLLVAAAAIVDGLGLLLIIPILERVAGGGRGWVDAALTALGLTAPLLRLAALLAAFVLLAVLRAATLYARDMALARLSNDFVAGQRTALMRVLADAPWHRVVGLRHAEIVNLLTTEIGRVAAACSYLIQGLVALVLLVVQTALAFALSPLLASATAMLVLTGGGAMLLAQGRVRDLGTALVRGNAALMDSAGGFLGGLKAAAAQNAQAAFLAEFETMQREVRGHMLAFTQRQARGRRVFAIGSGLAAAGVVLAGFALHVPPAVLITLVLIFARMSGPAIALQQTTQNFVFALPAFEALQAFEHEIAGGGGGVVAVAPPPDGAIVGTHLRYNHAGGGGVRDATFSIAPGAFVGVAGPSGAGKTTLVDLLIGLLEPQAGTLAVGGQVLDAGGRAGWRERVAYVPQEGFLFHDTVRRNLAWGNPVPDDPAMWRALTLVGADAPVRRLPDGLDTVVGERGTLLSGGERQRLSLARAVLRRPRLLVLDEATNAIDAASERVLLARLAALDPRPTILMISHRPESFAACDRILRIENGVVTS